MKKMITKLKTSFFSQQKTFLNLGKFLLLLAFINSFNLNAQNESKYWIFGAKSNASTENPYTPINFEFIDGVNIPIPMRPEPSLSATLGNEGTAVVTNPYTGELLFYTDGISVFDDEHTKLDVELDGDISSTTPTVVCPVPVCPFNEYYIFSNGSGVNVLDGQLSYRIFNVENNTFSEKLQLPGEFSQSQVLEGMKIIPSLTDPFTYWLIYRLADADNSCGKTHLTYKIDPSGISFHNSICFGIYIPNDYLHGNIDYGVIPNDSKNVVVGFAGMGLYTSVFDTETGLFDMSSVKVYNDAWNFDVIFSPDGLKLYYSSNGKTTDISAGLYQIDLTADNQESCLIKNFGNGANRSLGLQLGPDSKIYHIHSIPFGSNIEANIGRIENPNEKFINDSVNPNFFTKNLLTYPGIIAVNFPEFITMPKWDASITIESANSICSGETATIFSTVDSKGADIVSYNWYKNGELLNEGNSQSLETSSLGTYHLEVEVGSGCIVMSNEIEIIEATNCDSICSFMDLAIDTILQNCDSSNVELTIAIQNLGLSPSTSPVPFSIYSSDYSNLVYSGTIQEPIDSNATITVTAIIPRAENDKFYIHLNDSGSYILNGYPVTDIEECDYSNNVDSINVSFPYLVLDLGNDTTICNNTTLILNAPNGFDSHIWLNSNSTASTYEVYGEEQVHIEVTDACGMTYTDNIIVSIHDTIVDIYSDITICNDTSDVYEITLDYPENAILIPFIGVTQTSNGFIINPNTTTHYNIEFIGNNACLVKDSFTVFVEQCGSLCTVDAGEDVTICNGNTTVLSATTLDCDSGISLCSEPILPSIDCSNASRTISGSGWENIKDTVAISPGDLFNGGINMNGGTLIVCGEFNPQNINFNSGSIIVLGSAVIPNMNMNDAQSVFENYGTVTFGNVTWNGTVNNHGNISFNNDCNWNNSQARLINTGSILCNQSLNNNGIIDNSGTITVNNSFRNNSQGRLTSSCTINVSSEFHNNGLLTNLGVITVGATSFINGSSTNEMESGSLLSTQNIYVNASIIGNGDNCALIKVLEKTTLNSNANFVGNISLCDANGIETNNISYESDCSCSANGSTSQLSFNWSPSTGLESTTGSQVIANPSTTTTYTVEVTDANGNTSSDMVTVFVENCNSPIETFPNPYTTYVDIIIRTTSATTALVQISGMNGNTHYSNNSVPTNETFRIYPPTETGTYILQVVTDEFTKQETLIKE
jgi:formylmethanofuran dehydrogenase subunit C